MKKIIERLFRNNRITNEHSTASAEQVPAQPLKKSKQDNYLSLFCKKRVFQSRASVYLSRDTSDRIALIIKVITSREVSAGAYLENIVLDHFEKYKDEINALYESKFQKPL